MSILQIRRGDYSPISAHFNAHELYSKSSDAPAVHPFRSELVDALEYLRNHYGTPWRATSTFRTASEERAILNELHVPFFEDEHMKGEAVDSQPANNSPAIMLDLASQFLTNGPVYQELRKLGINGFGLYTRFIHLDTRTEKRPHLDVYGRVAHWDSRSNNGSSPWGVAFANQKKSVVGATVPKLNPTSPPKKLRPLMGPITTVGSGLASAFLRG